MDAAGPPRNPGRGVVCGCVKVAIPPQSASMNMKYLMWHKGLVGGSLRSPLNNSVSGPLRGLLRAGLLSGVLTTVATLPGCGLLPEQVDVTKGWSVTQLYATAKEARRDGDNTRSIELYDKLLARYPFGKYAQAAYLEKAYVHFKADEPDAAIATLDRFIKTYPDNPAVDYAYYLKGLVNHERGQSFIQKYLPIDQSQRDPGASREAFLDFADLLNHDPNSKYAEDARKRMLFLRNSLAKYEVNVAEWYMRRGAYLAAANRGQYVVRHFQKSPAVKDALVVMVAAYDKLDLPKLRDDAERVLKLNYPDAKRKEFKEQEKSLWQSMKEVFS